MISQWPIEACFYTLQLLLSHQNNSSKYILSSFVHLHFDLYNILPWITERDIWRLKKFSWVIRYLSMMNMEIGVKILAYLSSLWLHWMICSFESDLSNKSVYPVHKIIFNLKFNSLTRWFCPSSWRLTRVEDYQWISVRFLIKYYYMDCRRLKYSTHIHFYDNFMVFCFHFEIQ